MATTEDHDPTKREDGQHLADEDGAAAGVRWHLSAHLRGKPRSWSVVWQVWAEHEAGRVKAWDTGVVPVSAEAIATGWRPMAEVALEAAKAKVARAVAP